MKKVTVTKGLTLAATLVFAAGIMAGCSTKQTPKEGANGETVTIQWWTPNWDETESREMAAEFEQAHPDIKVDLVITDWETYKNKITTAISTKKAPELFTILLTDVKPLADKGLLSPLSRLGTEAGIDYSDFIKPALDITSVGDEVYGVPFRYDGSGIYYNVALLKAAGYDAFPKTWDDMVAMSKELSTDGSYAFAWPLGNQANAVTRFIQQLYTYGGDVLNHDETQCLLDRPQSVTALSNIVNSINEGYASPSSLEIDNTKMRDLFGTGQLAFNFTGPFDVDSLKTDYPDLEWKTAVIPGDGGMGCTTANGWCVSMAKNSLHQEAAAKLLAYITTPENQARLTDSFPASKTAIAYEKYSTEALKPFAEQLDNSRPEPTYTNWAEMEPIVYNYIQSAVSGSMSPQDACSQMAKDINAIIAED